MLQHCGLEYDQHVWCISEMLSIKGNATPPPPHTHCSDKGKLLRSYKHNTCSECKLVHYNLDDCKNDVGNIPNRNTSDSTLITTGKC